MELVRYLTADSPDPHVGVLVEGGIAPMGVGMTLGRLWSLPLSEIRDRLVRRADADLLPLADARLLAPIDGNTEVWAAGVTYEISRQARMEESGDSDVYLRVYDADRPELFFKSAAWRVVGPGDTVAVRADSTVTVPEPELAVVVNRYAEIVGVTICNDVSSRSIEGENPLYLPQAKVYLGACAVGPSIRPIDELPDLYGLSLDMEICRADSVVWRGSTSTSRLHRRIDELVRYLVRADVFPEGCVLSTGTCLVPEAPFTLQPGDSVRISLEGVGVLHNGVVAVQDKIDGRRAAVPVTTSGGMQ